MSRSEGFVAAQDGVRLFYQKVGSGKDAVIIPNAIHMFDSFESLADHRTVVFFDLRNRGRSEAVTESARLTRGIHHDVDDIEAVRRHFAFDRVALLGHSYQGLAVILYALKYPASVARVVQIGAVQPSAATQYPAHLMNADATLTQFLARLPQLQQQVASEDPIETARKFWALLRVLMVANAADADKIRWTPFQSPNERNFMKHWTENLAPSIQALEITPREVADLKAPVLAIHGTKDRQAPYGGGREWALILPNARLLTIETAAHVPWIETPDLVFSALETFLGGMWPQAAEQVRSLDPRAGQAEPH